MKKYITPIIAAALFVGCGVKAPDISLIEAATEGDLDAVKQHIAAGTDLNQKAPNPAGAKATALGIAAALGHTEVAIALIEGGANVDQRDKDGSTILFTWLPFCVTRKSFRPCWTRELTRTQETIAAVRPLKASNSHGK